MLSHAKSVTKVDCLISHLPLAAYYSVRAVCAWLPSLISVKFKVLPGELCARVVDVGQGSAAVMDTAGHRILLDTEPRFGLRDVFSLQYSADAALNGTSRFEPAPFEPHGYGLC